MSQSALGPIRAFLGEPALAGFGITLSPVQEHDLVDLASTCDAQTFRYYSTSFSAATPEEFIRTFRLTIQDQDRLHFVIRDQQSGQALGSSGFFDVLPAHLRLELGCTWYHPASRGTHVNPAAKLLLLTHAFESLACVRVQIKTDARNVHSQRAIEKLGATFEGRLRHHFIMPDGYLRDTMMYSITHHDWPKVKEGLLNRLAALTTR